MIVQTFWMELDSQLNGKLDRQLTELELQNKLVDVIVCGYVRGGLPPSPPPGERTAGAEPDTGPPEQDQRR